MLSDNEIEGILEARKAHAEAHTVREVAEKRRTVDSFFEAEDFGNEQEGRSQAIITTVRDKVQGLMPSMMKVFAGSEKVCSFTPVGPEDDELAKQAQAYVNHILMAKNKGYQVIYTACMDALTKNNCITKVYVEVVDRVKREENTGITIEVLEELEANPNIALVGVEEYDTDIEIPEGTFQQRVYDVVFDRSISENFIRVANVKPENFHIEDGCADIQDAAYLCEDRYLTVSDLIEEGVDPDLAKSIPAHAQEDEEERPDHGGINDTASRVVKVTEHYAKIDIEETDVARGWKIKTADNMILEKEVWDDDWPYQSGSPIPRAHEFFGISLGEEVADIQMIQSAALRAALDNMYSINNGAVKVFESQAGQVDIDAVLDKRVDRVIRIQSAPGGHADVVPLETQPIINEILPVIHLLDDIAEQRTGVTKNGQGLDPNMLHKTPATTANFMMTLAQEKQALIVRNLAQYWMMPLCKAIYSLARKYDAQERALRIRGQFAPVEPGKWPQDMDLISNVGLGTGNKQQQAQNAMALIAGMEKAGAQGMVSPDNMFNAAEEYTHSLGFQHVERFFTDPNSPEGQRLAAQRQQQGQNQAEMALVQLHAQKQQADLELQKMKFQLEVQKVQTELALKQKDIDGDHEVDVQSMLNEFHVNMTKIQQEAEQEGMEMALEASLEREKLAQNERLGKKRINTDVNIKDPTPNG